MKLKQWAGNKGTEIHLKIDNKDLKLEDYLDIEKAPFDPLELYAYNIGLSINNLFYGVFLQYYMSFPVTYDKSIKEKIKKSFEKGIKKSLPNTILEDKTVMKDFHIYDYISEPEAYAACVLQAYNIQPDDYDKKCVFFGIFDFGGGTTDYNFGLWQNPTDSRSNKDYKMTVISNDGLGLLGGENLLDQLAFEIFKYNQGIMREGDYAWVLPLGCKPFAGSETLLIHSQEAEKNMKNLVGAIRKYWEDYEHQLIEKTDENTEEIVIPLTLYKSSDGSSNANIQLEYTKSKIKDFFRKNVERGIDNYFAAQLRAFVKLDKSGMKNDISNTILIFLAGNSCKCPLVKELFDKYIGEEKESIDIQLFPPLGTKEACSKISEKTGEQIDETNLDLPTGKTGVAYGLIECRREGPIELVSLDSDDGRTPFKYYIGRNIKRHFVILNPDEKVNNSSRLDYDKWYLFASATNSLEIYYSDLPECARTDKKVPIPSLRIRGEKIEIPENSEGNVYIRVVDSQTIEYIISNDVPIPTAKGIQLYFNLD